MRSRPLDEWIQRLLWDANPSEARAWAGRHVDAWLSRQTVGAPAGVGVAVTGLQWGGAGRTPVTRWLARRAAAQGVRIGVIGHGYRGAARAPERVDRNDPAWFGDEAVELWQTCPAEVEVWVGRPRASLAETLAQRCGLVLMDISWPASTIGAGQRVIVVDASAPDAAWPAGPRRASPQALLPGDIVWLHRADTPHPERPPRWAMDRCAARSRVVATGLIEPGGTRVPLSALRGAQVFGACGIARPSEFWRLARGVCEAEGARWLDARSFADHSRFARRDLPASAQRAVVLVTTKDHARMPHAGFWALETDLEVDRPEALDGLWNAA